MDVAQLLDAFALAPYIEVVVAGLPENGGGAKAPRLFCGLRVPKGPLFHGVSSIQHFQVAELCSAGQPRAAVPTWFVLVDAGESPAATRVGMSFSFFLAPYFLDLIFGLRDNRIWSHLPRTSRINTCIVFNTLCHSY